MDQRPPNLDRRRRPLLRRVAGTNRLVRAARAARLLKHPVRFVGDEAVRRDGRARRWTLRDRPGSVVLRSGTGDFDIFDEIFRASAYEPPSDLLPVLESTAQIADLGANIGLFSAWASARFAEARLILVEPDPGNIEVLKLCWEGTPDPARWELIEAAAGARTGAIHLAAGRHQLSRLLTDEEAARDDRAIEVPMVDVFPLVTEADLIKIDIEGGEWEILADGRMASLAARAIVLEYHRRDTMPGDDPPEVAERLLRAAGFDVRHVFWNPPWVGQLWAWRRGAGRARR